MRNPIELLKASYGSIKQNLNLYIGISLVLGVFSLLSAYAEPFRTSGVASLLEQVIFVVLVLAYMVISVLAAIGLTLSYAGRVHGVGEAYKQAGGYFWRYIGFSILLTLIIVIGYILLIVPGIIFSVWFVFGGYVLVLEGAGIKESLVRSKEYVKGKWMAVFLRAAAFMLMSFVIFPLFAMFALILPDSMWSNSLISTLGSLVVTVFGIGYFYHLYQDAKGGIMDGAMEVDSAASASAAPSYGGQI